MQKRKRGGERENLAEYFLFFLVIFIFKQTIKVVIGDWNGIIKIPELYQLIISGASNMICDLYMILMGVKH